MPIANLPVSKFDWGLVLLRLFYDPSFGLFRRAAVYPRHYLLKRSDEALPPALGALVVLRLIRPEARLLHAQMGSRASRRERPSHHTL